MFKILDGRDKFYQWDIDRKLIVEDASISEVHFSNRTDDYALVVKTYVENGITLANVPNILLQTDWRIHVYAVDGNYTKHEKSYEIIARTKPSDYVYTETEIINWQYIKTQLDSKADAADVYTKIEVDTELERIKYYGDSDIIPSDESYFTVNETGETITGLTDTGKTQTELVIPYKINGKEITTLNSEDYFTSILFGNSVITKVVIPNSVTSIGGYAFSNCLSLTSINIPNSVTSISHHAFQGCTGLTSITIPNSATSIGDYAFNGCTSLTSITIPNSVTSIGGYTFMGCSSLTSITIPNSVISIEEFAFAGCSSLTSLNIPNSVTSIESSAFAGCSLLTTIYCEQGSYAETYANTNNIPVVYTDVKDMATETELERLKYYGDKDIIPSLERYFTVNETGETITGLTDTGKTQTELVIPYKINGKEITTLYSGSDYKSILYGATDKITKVVIPNSVTSIGSSAFYSCTSLTSINIPNSVTSIGNIAFSLCTSLTSINIPNSVTSIEDGAFNGCTGLTSINIPNSVISIGSGAFYYCTNLKIYCEQGSYAETYAKENNISVTYTDVKATSINPDVKNAIDTIAVNTIYDLGVQTALNITLPSGQIGDFIEFDFISGETATNLTVNSSSGLVGFDLIPGTNTIYTLYFDWGVAGYDGTSITHGWRCNYSEYSITV